jgi:hypothetical protein
MVSCLSAFFRAHRKAFLVLAYYPFLIVFLSIILAWHKPLKKNVNLFKNLLGTDVIMIKPP